MKGSYPAFVAIVLAITVSAFTAKPYQTVYFVYNGFGSQTALYNYQVSTSSPALGFGGTTLFWFRGYAADAGDVGFAEFWDSFDAIDNHCGGTIWGTLDDEWEDGINLEKGNPWWGDTE